MANTRNYSLFRKVGNRWVHVDGTGAYPRSQAIRIFQDRLLAGSFSGERLELRPVKASASPVPANHKLCASCEAHHHDCAGGSCSCGCRMHRG